MEQTKTIILNNKNKSNFKGILNLKQKEKSVLSLYNFEKKDGKYALGIKQNDKIEKINLFINKNSCSFELPTAINLKEKFSCAFVDVSNDFCPEIILSESLNNHDDNEKIESAFVVKKPDDVSNLYETDENEHLSKLVEDNLNDDMNSTYYDCCAKCKYRQAFYESNKNTISSLSESSLLDEKFENVIADEPKSIFYEQIKSQIDKLFDKYEKYDLLSNIIPNSKWVKVDYEQNGDYYVLGLICDDENKFVEYIAYGIPAHDNLNPPDDIKEYAKWLPIDRADEDGEGFWIAYQNANDGENVKINID